MMRTVEDHLASVLAAVEPIETETLELADAHGRTLREPVRAGGDMPRFDNSAMDGFAVRFADVAAASDATPVTLRVIADLPAGSDIDPPIAPGEAARIMTGSAVPTDADGIVPFEDTAGGLEDSLADITVLAPPRGAGVHIRRQGEEGRAGDVVLPAGLELGALQLGSAAAADATTVVVSRRPRVAVISTGTELVAPGSDMVRGQIPESNSAYLVAAVADAASDVVLRASVPDDGELLQEVLEVATELGADVVVMSGGVSAGAYEVVKGTLTQMEFSKVAMQPGKPQGFGAGSPLLFGLPGNPVSVAVSFEMFVRPALLALQGRSRLHRHVVRLPATAGWRTPPGRRQYLPVVFDDGGVRPATSGGSHLVGGVARAEAYAIVPADVDAVEAGDTVDVMLIP